MASTTLELGDRMARRRRRLVLPLFTAVVALVVWILNARVGPGREADVEVFVRRLIAEAAPPQPSMSALPETEPVISDLVRETLRDMQADGVPPTFTLRRRATDGGGGHPRTTHTATIVDDGGARMALGIAHAGDVARMAIVGVEIGAVPEASSASPATGGS